MSPATRPVVIIGAGGHAREVLDVVEACREDGQAVEPVGFLVDPEFQADQRELRGLPILGGLEWLEENSASAEVIVAVGAPELRFRLAKRARAYGARFTTAIHPAATLTRRVTIGEGSVIMAGCRLTTDLRLGRHVHLLLNSTLAHDVTLEDFVSVFAGANISGSVYLGEGALVGAGAVLVEKTRVGAWSRIGAGSTVLGPVGANVTAVGVPARVVRTREPGWHLPQET